MPHTFGCRTTGYKRCFGNDADSVMHSVMLPILRILPVGGVLLAIFILVLALKPAGRIACAVNVRNRAGAWRADRSRPPARRRANSLSTPPSSAPMSSTVCVSCPTPRRAPTMACRPKVASLPSDRSDTDPDETGTINETPAVSIPVEIGEPSSTELPVAAPRGKRAGGQKSEPDAKPQREPAAASIACAPPGRRRARAQPRQFNFFEMLFGGQQYQQPRVRPQRPAPDNQQTGQRTTARYVRPDIAATAAAASRRQATSFPRCLAPLPTSAELGSQRKSNGSARPRTDRCD